MKIRTLAFCLSLCTSAAAFASPVAGIMAPTQSQLVTVIRSSIPSMKSLSAKKVRSAKFEKLLARPSTQKLEIDPAGPDTGTTAYLVGNRVYVQQQTIAGPFWKQGTLPTF